LPRLESAQPTAKQDREQYAQWWTSAESQAYFALLKERLNVQVLVASPTKELVGTGKPAAKAATQSASQ